VTAAAHAANQRTRSFGVAFSGVVLPGSTQPLFSVADGRMAVGMGIHGEPGLGEVDLPTADELAQLLTATLLDERPDCAPTTSGARVAVVLNGLGSVKHEELFVVYRRISQLLNDAGVTIVEPEVGELITSFEMAGVSLTLAWLDAELERGWTADAMTPAFRRGTGMLVPPAGAAYPQVGATDPLPVPETNQPDGTIASTDAARVVLDCLRAMSRTIDHNVEELGQLDAIAGDGDHGIGMQRGSIAAAAAAEAAVEHGAGAGTTLARAADAWSDRAGGTSGLLWGILLAQLGLALGDQDRPGIAEFARGIEAGEREVVRFGKARIGDKTMVDVLSPFAESLAESARSGLDIVNALTIAAGVAEDAAKATADLIPLIGRARPHAEKSLGTPDPGARSLALLIRAVQNVLLERKRKQ
jgi:dihydroxyacetone kinase